MRLALGTSILLTIFKGEPGAEAWMEALISARRHLIPDFLIAAHAQTQADCLAARDRGYLRNYFPDLALLDPQPDLGP